MDLTRAAVEGDIISGGCVALVKASNSFSNTLPEAVPVPPPACFA